MTETREALAKKIRELREASDHTQVSLAEALEVSQQTVSAWETGATAPTIDILPRLAAALGVEVAELFEAA